MAILFIGPTRLGDGILVSGLLHWLHGQHPQEEITLACGAPAALALRHASGVASLHIMQKRPRGGHWLDLWRATYGRRWRRIVDLRRSALPWLLRADARHSVPKGAPGEHRVAQAARTLDLPPQAPRLWLDESHRLAAARLLPEGRPVLALGTGANWICKTWPATRFAELIDRLTGPGGVLGGSTVLLVGGADERKSAATVIDGISQNGFVDAFGYDLPTTAALLERADVFVGNDSAMMHLAAATGTRTIGLFGPTQDAQYAPWGRNALVVRTPESIAQLQALRDADGARASASQMTNLEAWSVADAMLRRWPELAHG
ncbi:glycosyltransferase family 9 protein [Falsiroseomonas tokyonensis]|uniref:Glycosyltransferase family 9 protein n=1 Tax=Falsiroseomonas tokyonensis TaxID=430521 RepID=A0ABV7C428_9PROT|nr:glycosyltransferase family 9 protein [Falsiroseomonas tokyonensis]MBU8541644.1 glycosyltransferase family 9 protein [Falsiroseomonas tokyonensis]